jgi:predicted exporter/SAM-dependent methyltransferase
LLLAGVGLLTWLGFARLQIDSNVLNVLPSTDPVVADTKYVLAHHPVLETIVIDLSLNGGAADRDRLAAAADTVAARLADSELVRGVSQRELQQAVPRLYATLVDRLPLLFTSEQLAAVDDPRAWPQRVADSVARLYSLEGVGQTELIRRDPLALRDQVFARLAQLGFGQNVQVHKNHLFSADGRHVLLRATQKTTGADTNTGRALTALFADVEQQLNAGGAEPRVVVEAIGTFRASLDNETIIRRDAAKSLTVASVGSALLLLATFFHPWLGLLALVPAFAGSCLAIFVYSLARPSISALTFGFAGVVIGITVDHGIAHLLLLDRRNKRTGRQAGKEAWTAGLTATVTNVGALFALHLSGFPVLSQIGLFAGLGVACSFVFSHVFFALLFPRLPEWRTRLALPVDRLVHRLTHPKTMAPAIFALVLFAGLAVFARPVFRADLEEMNTVSAATLAAENRIKEVWGDPLNRVYVFVEADSPERLLARFDDLAALLRTDVPAGMLDSVFHPGQLFPGPRAAAQNLAAWKNFWTADRQHAADAALASAGATFDVPADFFRDFSRALRDPAGRAATIPPAVEELLGIARDANGKRWTAMCPVSPGAAYDAEQLRGVFAGAGFRLQDPKLFSKHLSALVGETFLKMFLIAAAAVVLLISLFLLDWRMILLALATLAFGFVCTLGVKNLLGLPLDIPGLMLAVMVLGMGVDYALYFIHSQQRYFRADPPVKTTFRSAALLAGAGTLIGMLSLALADHRLLHSAGLTNLLGLGFTLLGAFLILPPMFARMTKDDPPPANLTPHSPEHRRWVNHLYRHAAVGVRMFARFKMRLDPMFGELANLVGDARRLIDIGCGYGVPAAWLIALRPDRRVFALEPDAERADVAAQILAPWGEVRTVGAPDLPDDLPLADAALLLDMAHYLSAADLAATLRRLHARLEHGAALVMRVTVPHAERATWWRRIEEWRLRVTQRAFYWRSAAEIARLIGDAGFTVTETKPTAPGREETWFIARRA